MLGLAVAVMIANGGGDRNSATGSAPDRGVGGLREQRVAERRGDRVEEQLRRMASTGSATSGHADGGTGVIRELELVPPHDPDELRTGLTALAESLRAIPPDTAAERDAALLRLRMYRFLCGLPESGLRLDDRLNQEAIAAADICRRLGMLSHEPANPGLPEEDYARARRGAAAGNLASGVNSLIRAVDGWMDDSDRANIDVLGHRRWCLNPPLERVGFCRIDGWCAMWAHDTSGSERLRLPAVCYPPPGQVPIDMFRPNYAWSITLNPRFFRQPRAGEIRVEVREARGTVMELDKHVLETGGYGIGNCIIFRPRDLSTSVGAQYEVRVLGVVDHDERERSLRYRVDFIAY